MLNSNDSEDIKERMKFMYEYQKLMIEQSDKMMKGYINKGETFESYSNK